MRLHSIVNPNNLKLMYELVEKLPAGDFVEVGVFHGGSAEYLYEVTERQGRTLHLFDTFTGTPFYTHGLDHHQINNEFAAIGAPQAIASVMPNAKIYMGIYPETHPDGLVDIAFIHCDCDQYLSYRAVIDNLWPLLVPSGVLLFDDYPYLPGAKKAVEESFGSDQLLVCGQRYYVIKQ